MLSTSYGRNNYDLNNLSFLKCDIADNLFRHFQFEFVWEQYMFWISVSKCRIFLNNSPWTTRTWLYYINSTMTRDELSIQDATALSHGGQVTHICVFNICHHWLKQWLIVCSAPSHHLNQCWLIGHFVAALMCWQTLGLLGKSRVEMRLNEHYAPQKDSVYQFPLLTIVQRFISLKVFS